MSWKASGLHSLVVLLAVLSVVHPDRKTLTKFKNDISDPKINCKIIQERRALGVCEGFWEGADGDNLGTIFTTETIEGRKAGEELLLDYDSIFGLSFAACHRDIRPSRSRRIPPTSNPTLRPSRT